MNFAIKQNTQTNYTINNSSYTKSKTNANTSNVSTTSANTTNTRLSESAALLNTVKNFGLKNNLGNLFSSYIRNFSLNDDGSLKSIGQIDIKASLEEMATSYVYLQNSIQTDDSLTKEEKEQMTATLDLAFNQGLNDFASNYALSSDSFLQDYGIKNSGSSIIDSVHNIVQDKIATYNEFLQSEEANDYFTSKDIKLNELNFDEFVKELDKGYADYQKQMATKSKEANSTEQTNTTSNANTTKDTETQAEDDLYSLNNLASMYQIAKASSGFRSSNINSSEEEIAFNAATEAIATLDILKKNAASKEFTELLSDGLYSKLQNDTNNLSKNLQAKQDMVAQYSEVSASHYEELDSSRVFSLYRQMVNTYNSSSDAVNSVINSFEIAKNSFANNYDASLTRYSNGSDFFNNFYEVDKQNSYSGQMSIFKSICNNFKAININLNI